MWREWTAAGQTGSPQGTAPMALSPLQTMSSTFGPNPIVLTQSLRMATGEWALDIIVGRHNDSHERDLFFVIIMIILTFNFKVSF